MVSKDSVSPGIICVGVAFCLMFAANTGVANIATQSAVGSIWMQAEAACYFSHASVCLFVPYIVSKLGSRRALFFGSVGYVVYSVGAVFLSFSEEWGTIVLYCCSIVKGVMSPILWTGYGVYKSEKVTPETQGLNDGMFFAIYRINTVLGNSLILFCDSMFKSLTMKYTFFLFLGCLACLLFLAIMVLDRPLPRAKKVDISFFVKLKEAGSAFTSVTMLLMLTISLSCTGMLKAWYLGDFNKFGAYEGANATLFSGLCSFLASIFFGSLFDQMHDKRVMLKIGTMFGAVTIPFALFSGILRDIRPSSHIYRVFVYCTALTVGVGVAGVDVSLSASYGIMFGDEASKAYAAHQVVYALGTSYIKFLGGKIEPKFYYARLRGQVYAENEWEIPETNGLVMSWESICDGREQNHEWDLERWYKEPHVETFTNFLCETPYNQKSGSYDTFGDRGNDRRTPFAIGRYIHAVIPESRAPNNARRMDGDVEFTPKLAKVLKRERPLNLYSLMCLSFCLVISTLVISYIPPISTARSGRSPTYRRWKR